MYVRMYNDLKKQKEDNPTIGILLCTETDKTIDKYSVLAENNNLFATKYMDYSLRYEHYSDFAKINDNGTVGKGIGQLSLRIAYGFEL